MSRLLVTGADGFVGTALCPAAEEKGMFVRRVVRALPSGAGPGDWVGVGDLSAKPDWSDALIGVDVVIHLAGRAHLRGPSPNGSEAEFRDTNVGGTVHLAESARAAGVRRIVFVSSVKAQGERTMGRPLREEDLPTPMDPYGRSKLEAEHALVAMAAATGLEVVIVRPPLVYGPGVRGNLRRLLALLKHRLPLPLKGVHNRRSLIGLTNLCDALLRCAVDPRAAGQTFLVADGEDLSTPDLLQYLADGLGRRAILFPAPPTLLRMCAPAFGMKDDLERLLGDLQVDCSKIRTRLEWHPVKLPADGLRETGRWYATQ